MRCSRLQVLGIVFWGIFMSGFFTPDGLAQSPTNIDSPRGSPSPRQPNLAFPRERHRPRGMGHVPCLEGSYFHRYEHQRGSRNEEVWLCCVPIEELLKDSFKCQEERTILPGNALIGGKDYQKVRSCYFMDPKSSKKKSIPACIPAPITLEDVKQK